MAHGDTQEAALANVREAVELWIETAREFGDPIPEPKGRRLQFA
jgi:predicted RNase H-like HicB family nuclease